MSTTLADAVRAVAADAELGRNVRALLEQLRPHLDELELPLDVTHDAGRDRASRLTVQARILDGNGMFLAELFPMAAAARDATDPQATALAAIVNAVGHLLATLPEVAR